MFELYATGNYSLKALLEAMHKEGLRTREGRRLQKSRLHELLSHPFYYGKIPWKGELYAGEHEPLITRDLFDAVQVKLTRKVGSPQYQKHFPVFKAKLECQECAGTITWEVQKGHWYGHCNHRTTCSQKKYIRQEKVEEQLFPHFDKVAPKSQRILKILEKALKESHWEATEYTTARRSELNHSFERIEKRLEVIYEDKIDHKIAQDFYERKFKQYTAEKEQILSDLKKLNDAKTKYYEAGYSIHELALRAKDIYNSKKATTEEKRLLLSRAFSKMTLQDGKLLPNYSLAFEFLATWMPKANEIFELIQNTAESGALYKTLGFDMTSQVMESLEPRNKIRTSRNPHPITRFSHSTTESGYLLRWQDSNLQPTP